MFGMVYCTKWKGDLDFKNKKFYEDQRNSKYGYGRGMEI